MGFTPSVWGPYFWKTIHTGAFGLDVHSVHDVHGAGTKFRQFIQGIGEGIPCLECETHFEKFQQTNPLPSQSGGFSDPTFLKWTIQAHNAVRARNNKPVSAIDMVVKAYQAGAPFDEISPLPPHPKDQIGWQIGFVLVSVMAVVLLVVVIVQSRRCRKYRR